MLDGHSSDIFDSSAISFDPATNNHLNHHENTFNHFPNLDHHHLLHHPPQNQHFINMEQPQFPLHNHDNNEQQQQQQESALTMFENNINNCLTTTPLDLLNLFQLPKCSSSSISFSNPTQVMSYDHSAALPPPFFKDLLNSLPSGFNLTGCCGSIFGDMEMETSGHHHHHQQQQQQGLFHQGGGDHTLLEFGNGKGIRDNINNNNNKDTKHFATEKHRRLQLNGKFDALKRLVPNPTKPDRASVVGDAINYINELKRTVEELKILVERKRYSRGRMKKHKTDDDSTLDVESIYSRSYGAGNGNGNGGGAGDASHDQQAYNGSSSSTMRTSWLQRKSKNTEIDVRIIDDEVTIKIVQQKRINCLLLVSKVLDELQLDLHHVAGGLIGDFYSYLFNTKICEGSSVYASAIANKLIEMVDKQYAAIPVTSSYQVEN